MSASNYSQHWRRTIMPAMGKAPCPQMLPAEQHSQLTLPCRVQGWRL